ncbi:hypothetical protein IEE91_07375 [Kocuria sp. cx-455]|uniref:hypothetical protein n=1 Tax=unclassified Candidatus Sulfotelmatobacter TaxID=2635724 RepID=UPI0016821DF7|nr:MULTISPECIES: hypothetical protein [unclassified Candidatus Sulfotelmatobacter]MBD2761380.1 hypothetical protein [Kocuria sp. cx-116]MBD2765006.1 hypothetical protein [Kocuria sp. cx-455]
MKDDAKPSRKTVWRWVLIFGGYFFVSAFLDDWIADQFTASMSALVAIGGYWLSNVAVGLLTGTGCYVVYTIISRRLTDQLVNGDPEPLPAHFDYVTQAQPSLWFGWFGGLLFWAVGLVMLIVWYPAAWIVGPIIGTTIIAGGLRSMTHARAMDAQCGGNTGGA